MSAPPNGPDPAWVEAHTLEASLSDGTPVVIRPILPDDKQRMIEGLRRLSPESRYLRFLRAVSDLSEAELAYLTEIDYHDHFAWAALAADQPGQPGIGVARYIRESPGSERAEAAVAVIDDYQGRGLGTLLLRLLAETAWEHGISTFVAYAAPVNARVLELVDLAGGVARAEGELVRVEVPLGAEEPGEGSRLLLRAAAAGRAAIRPPPDGRQAPPEAP